jgi:hypothetical protein
MKRVCLLIAAGLGLAPHLPAATTTADLIIYGGTSAGVIAAVQAKRMGKSVVIVCPDKHLGGLSSGGLGFTDTGDKSVIGGLAREFYHRIWQHYDRPEAWRWQKKEQYGNKGQGTPAIDGENRTMWIFAPHVAEQVFEDFVREHHLRVDRDEWLDRARGVQKKNGRITSITMLSGKTMPDECSLTPLTRVTSWRPPVSNIMSDAKPGRFTAKRGTACRPGCCITATISES